MTFRHSTLAFVCLASLAVAAQAQGQQYRLMAETYGAYYNNVQTTSSVFGTDPFGNPNTVSGTTYYGSAYYWANAYDQATPVPDVSYTGTWTGDTTQGMTTVSAAGYGKTGWGSNHASASLSGFTKVEQSYDGQFVVGPTTWPMHVETSNEAYSTGRSIWEELYQIGGGTGTGQFTGSIHVDGILSGTTGDGVASLNWNLTTFSNQVVASVYASYFGASDAWTLDVFSNGTWVNTSGTGALVINQDVIGSYTFNYGDALYLKSDLYTSVSGNGSADFSNTVQFTGMLLPQGTKVFVTSGAKAADYGISFAGDGSGTICQDLACATGGGGGTSPIPEPGTYALLLSGLGLIGWIVRRRIR